MYVQYKDVFLFSDIGSKLSTLLSQYFDIKYSS